MPTSVYAPYEQQLQKLLQDAAGKVSQAQQDIAIDEAVNIRFSADRPRVLVSDITGNDTNDLPLPVGEDGSEWEDGFSTFLWIEFPIGNVPESFIDPSDWRMYRTPTGLFLRLLATVPDDTDTIRVTWTVRQTPSTVPAGDFQAVCCYAAALCFESMAASYIQTMDAAIAGDTVNYRTKAQECMGVAKAFRTRYYNHIGTSEAASGGMAKPAATVCSAQLR